ncbi:unnamed protein product [Malus baccata var. baccata]
MPLSATLSLTSPKHNTTNHNSISFTLSIPISNPKHSPFNFNPPKPQDDPLITLRAAVPIISPTTPAVGAVRSIPKSIGATILKTATKTMKMTRRTKKKTGVWICW